MSSDWLYLIAGIILPAVGVALSSRFMRPGAFAPPLDIDDVPPHVAEWIDAQRHAAADREHLHRSRWQRVIGVLIIVGVVFAWSFHAQDRANDEARREQIRVDCQNTNRGRADARDLAVAEIDYIYELGGIDLVRRAEVVDGARRLADEMFPPLTC